jgi:Family of unknown function (DUF5947)
MQSPRLSSSFTTLRQFVRTRTPTERCELCGVVLLADHAHLFEPASRQLLCSCDACLVSIGDQPGTPYRRVPRQVRRLPAFQLSAAQWDGLRIPVGMAFFFYSSPAKKVMVFYPSPAGPTESLLSLESWAEIVRDNPILQTLAPDVEALLVNRLQPQLAASGADDQGYYLAPIDKCYELVGLIRTHWRGLSGGSEVWEAIQQFYARLQEQSE